MFYIHGGDFSHGASNLFPAHILAGFYDVVVVTFNYRLGALGKISKISLCGIFCILVHIRKHYQYSSHFNLTATELMIRGIVELMWYVQLSL